MILLEFCLTECHRSNLDSIIWVITWNLMGIELMIGFGLYKNWKKGSVIGPFSTFPLGVYWFSFNQFCQVFWFIGWDLLQSQPPFYRNSEESCSTSYGAPLKITAGIIWLDGGIFLGPRNMGAGVSKTSFGLALRCVSKICGGFSFERFVVSSPPS